MKLLVMKNRSRSTTVGNDIFNASFSRRYLKQTLKELENSDALTELQNEYLTGEIGMNAMVFEEHGWKIGQHRNYGSNNIYNCKLS